MMCITDLKHQDQPWPRARERPAREVTGCQGGRESRTGCGRGCRPSFVVCVRGHGSQQDRRPLPRPPASVSPLSFLCMDSLAQQTLLFLGDLSLT